MICIALTICKHACKVDCDVKSATGSTPLLTQSRTKDAWFFASFEAYKWQDLLEEGKMAAMRFEQVQRFILAK